MKPAIIEALSDTELIDAQFSMTSALKTAILSADPRATFAAIVRDTAEQARQCKHQFTNCPTDERIAWASRLDRLAQMLEGKGSGTSC